MAVFSAARLVGRALNAGGRRRPTWGLCTLAAASRERYGSGTKRFTTRAAVTGSSRIVRSPFPDAPVDDRPLCDFVFDACDRHAGLAAFIDTWSERTYSYDEVGAKCRAAAVGWHRVGLTKGDCVALLLPNCAEFIFALVGAADRGALCCGLNPTFAQYELSHYLGVARGGSGARFVVTIKERLGALGDTLAAVDRHRVEAVYVVDAHGDETLDELSGGVDVMPLAQLYGDAGEFDSLPAVACNTRRDAVYMAYSSGTTGMPKGTLVSHYMMAAHFAQLGAGLVAAPSFGDHSIMFLPVFHFYGFCFFLKQLLDGCVTVSLARFDPEAYFDAVQKYKAPVLYLVPPVMVMMAKHPLMDKFDLSCVTDIVIGAAPLGEGVIADTKRRFPSMGNILQGYGMTELGLSHVQTAKAGDGMFVTPGSVGPMMPNFVAKVVSTETGEDLGPDEVGELWGRGEAMMLGYHQNPEETKALIDEDNWLHTGDMCYYDSAGNFYMVDRVKELIKVSGFQVAPAELEDLLLSHPAVAEAAVVPVADPKRDQVPRAYIVLKRPDVDEAEKRRLAEEIAAFVGERAAHYKRLRGGVQFVDDIPKLASGKILRRILRERAEIEVEAEGGGA